ncbi:methylmalonyl Co-A mutase-associated GTPase MeaB [Sediminibacterium goheungense]|uniref:LAO/AO transport system kinase n=1 Tax=Sediminibacterium goheungense TaxID=1086393 RepID=A0A4R6IUV1_9BACT|nr:methylmalonyl Co-A mutase-associated GTPase MeaB [Sediminibacterium goheungense]TDO26400.1 LAO/AO transport system kinase [Sediminibacterium goheungense]
MWQQLLTGIIQQDQRALARSISYVENEVPGYENFLSQLPAGNASITGITGPPGAGKSTLVDALIHEWVSKEKKVGVLCVDPSSPFNLGAVLGDRIRMSEWYNHPNVFIRSLATRGALGGLHPHIIDITALMQATGFDHIIVETVGVGQSEIEIAGLADTTVVVVVPEAGDEVQTMKAGLMEIADIFVVNKSDRPEADLFVKNLRMMLAPAFYQTKTEIPVIKTVATHKTGIPELANAIEQHQSATHHSERKDWLLTERAWKLIQQYRMNDIDKELLKEKIAALRKKEAFNLFGFIQSYTK